MGAGGVEVTEIMPERVRARQAGPIGLGACPLREQRAFVLLVNLQRGRLAEDVKEALIPVVQDLPVCLRRSLTWDQGREMAEHQPFTIATGVQIYFCDPHSPWQRATNENSNGLLRQYFPRGTDLSPYSQADLNVVAAELNGGLEKRSTGKHHRKRSPKLLR